MIVDRGVQLEKEEIVEETNGISIEEFNNGRWIGKRKSCSPNDSVQSGC